MNYTITKVSNGFTVGYSKPSDHPYESGEYTTAVFTTEASLFKFLSKQFEKLED